MHEVVDLGDSGEEDGGEEDEEEDGEYDDEYDDEEMQAGTFPMGVGGAEESVMVLDSDSDSNEEEEEEDYGRGGQASSYYQQSHAGFRSLPGEQSYWGGVIK